MIVGFISVGDIELGKKFARELVENDSVACSKVLPGLTSFYKWEGKLESDSEVYIIIKTLKEKVAEIDKYLKENHPNKIYEFIYAGVEGNADYVNWVQENLLKK